MSAVPRSRDPLMTLRTIPASSAPPLFSRAPSSVFALGTNARVDDTADSVEEVSTRPAKPADAPARAKAPRTGQAIALIRERGPMTAVEVADALACDAPSARSLLCYLSGRGVGVVGKRGRAQLYGLADAPTAVSSPPAPVAGSTTQGDAAAPPAMGGFKRWLEGRGEPPEQPRASRRRGNASRTEHQAKPPAPAASVPPESPTPPTLPSLEDAGAAPELLCGLFNNGDLVLELGEQRMRLNKAQTRRLVTYLDMVASATLQQEES